MWCPKCANPTNVKATVKKKENYRLRDCPACDHVFQTVEAPKGSTFWDKYKTDLEDNDAVSQV